MSERKTKATLRQRLARTTSRFVSSDDGAVAAWFGILLVPMLGVTFAAIKFSDLAQQRSGMVDAMDAAALGLARQYKIGDLEPCNVAKGDETDTSDPDGQAKAKLTRYARELFNDNYPDYTRLYSDRALSTPLDLSTDLEFQLSCSKVRVCIDAWSDMGGILGEKFGVGAVPLDMCSEISLPGSGRVEIALVLDVTGSMGSSVGGVKKIDALKDAVKVMLDDPDFYGTADDTENDSIRISIVPFASTVNVDADYSGKAFDRDESETVGDWMDGWNGAQPRAHWHGANFFHTDFNGTVTGAVRDGTLYSSDRPKVRARKVNHFTLFDSVGEEGATWKGCVEARPFPLDEVPVPVDTRLSVSDYNAIFELPESVEEDVEDFGGDAEDAWDEIGAKPTAYNPRQKKNTFFVPFFYPDGPDCFASACDQTFYDDHYFTAFANVKQDGCDFPCGIFDSYSGSSYPNTTFVYDTLYTNPFYSGYTDVDTATRYRNVVWTARAVAGGGCAVRDYPVDTTNLARMTAITEAMGYDDCKNNEYRLRQGYVGYFVEAIDPADKDRYVGKYNAALDDYSGGSSSPSSDDMPGKGPNLGCPGPILPLTTKKADLVKRVEDLKANGTTNTAAGLIWGWRTLTPEAPFIQAADPDDLAGGRWRKFAVLMTDGDNYIVSNNSSTHKNHNVGPFTNLGFLSQDRLNLISGDPYDNRSTTRTRYTEELDKKTIRMCHRMRADGIKVFTVGFDITANSNAAKMLAACAVDADAFKLADDADDLADVFGEITSQIVDLHVSG